MQKKAGADLAVEVRLVNDYIMIYSERYDFRLVAGKITQDRILLATGQRVFDGLQEVGKRMRQHDPRQGKTEKEHKWIGIGLAAKQLHVSPNTIRRLIQEEKLLSVRTEGGHRRILKQSIDELAEKFHRYKTDEKVTNRTPLFREMKNER